MDESLSINSEKPFLNDDDDFPLDTITLVDDDNVEREFEVLDFIQEFGRKFYALTLKTGTPEENSLNDNAELARTGSNQGNCSEDNLYFIFEVVEKNGKEELIEVDDDNLLDELSKKFETRLGNI